MKCPSLNLVTFLVLKSALPNVSVAPSAFLVVTPKLSGLLTGADGQAPLSPFLAHVPNELFHQGTHSPWASRRDPRHEAPPDGTTLGLRQDPPRGAAALVPSSAPHPQRSTAVSFRITRSRPDQDLEVRKTELKGREIRKSV